MLEFNKDMSIFEKIKTGVIINVKTFDYETKTIFVKGIKECKWKRDKGYTSDDNEFIDTCQFCKGYVVDNDNVAHCFGVKHNEHRVMEVIDSEFLNYDEFII